MISKIPRKSIELASGTRFRVSHGGEFIPVTCTKSNSPIGPKSLRETGRQQPGGRDRRNRARLLPRPARRLLHRGVAGQQQAEVFETQLTLATELDLPVVIHTRKSGDDSSLDLEATPRRSGQCCTVFPDRWNRPTQALKRGHYLSFTGSGHLSQGTQRPGRRHSRSRRTASWWKRTALISRRFPTVERATSRPTCDSRQPRRSPSSADITDEEFARITTENAYRFFRHLADSTIALWRRTPDRCMRANIPFHSRPTFLGEHW